MDNTINLRNRQIVLHQNRVPPANQENRISEIDSNFANMPDTIPAQQMIPRLNVHMPLFKPDDIIAWFRRLEHWFNLQTINTEKCKYYLIASQLDHPALAHLPEWTDEPAENPYTVVKDKIIAIFQDSAQTRIQKLLEKRPLGDLKPSLMLAEMRNIAVGVSDEILRNLWIKRLPEAAQTVLALTPDTQLDSAAKAADSVVETINNAKAINQISSHEENQISECNLKIDALIKAFDNYKAYNNRSRSKSRNENQNKRFKSSSEGNSDKMCWYHRKFGIKAEKCLLPCKFELNPKN